MLRSGERSEDSMLRRTLRKTESQQQAKSWQSIFFFFEYFRKSDSVTFLICSDRGALTNWKAIPTWQPRYAINTHDITQGRNQNLDKGRSHGNLCYFFNLVANLCFYSAQINSNKWGYRHHSIQITIIAMLEELNLWTGCRIPYYGSASVTWNTWRGPNAGLMFGQRRRRWPNIEPALDKICHYCWSTANVTIRRTLNNRLWKQFD